MIEFLRREKIYILIFFFILAVNFLNLGRPGKMQVEEKKAVSSMTFGEIGITEEKVMDYLGSDRPGSRFFRYGAILGIFILILSIAMNIAFIHSRLQNRGLSLDFARDGSRDGELVEPKAADRQWPLNIPPTACLPVGRGPLASAWAGPIFFGKRPDGASVIKRGPISWGVPDILRAGLVIVFLSYALAIIEGLLFKMFNVNIGLNLRMMVNTFIIDLAAIIVVLYFVVVKHKERIHALGLKLSSFLKDVLSGVTAYIFILPFLLVVLFLSIAALNFFGYTPPPQPVFEVFMEERRSSALLFFTAFVSIFGPIAEEIFFRGFVYSAIKKQFGMIVSVLVSSALFSLLHANVIGFLPIMVLGVLLAYLYEATGSLVSSITVHIVHNSIIISFVFLIKELMA